MTRRTYRVAFSRTVDNHVVYGALNGEMQSLAVAQAVADELASLPGYAVTLTYTETGLVGADDKAPE